MQATSLVRRLCGYCQHTWFDPLHIAWPRSCPGCLLALPRLKKRVFVLVRKRQSHKNIHWLTVLRSAALPRDTSAGLLLRGASADLRAHQLIAIHATYQAASVHKLLWRLALRRWRRRRLALSPKARGRGGQRLPLPGRTSTVCKAGSKSLEMAPMCAFAANPT